MDALRHNHDTRLPGQTSGYFVEPSDLLVMIFAHLLLTRLPIYTISVAKSSFKHSIVIVRILIISLFPMSVNSCQILSSDGGHSATSVASHCVDN